MENQITGAGMGSFVTVNEFTGNWVTDAAQTVYLYDTAMDRISSQKYSTGAQTGNLIGSANLKSISYNSGTLGTANGQVDVYLMDIRMLGSNSFSNVRSLYFDNTSSADLGGDIVLNGNTAILQDTAVNPLLYYVGADAVKTISDMSFSYKHSKSDISIGTGGTYSLSLPSGGDAFPYGTATLSTAALNPPSRSGT